MRRPHKAVSRTIILQLAEKEQHLIFEKEDSPSERSDDINPLWLKLNVAAVDFLCQIKDWTSHTACSSSSLSTASCHLLAGRLFFFPFSLLLFTTKRTLGSCYHEPGSSARRCRNSEIQVFQLEPKGASVFKQTFNRSRVTAGTAACNSPAAVPSCRLKKMLSRC